MRAQPEVKPWIRHTFLSKYACVRRALLITILGPVMTLVLIVACGWECAVDTTTDLIDFFREVWGNVTYAVEDIWDHLTTGVKHIWDGTDPEDPPSGWTHGG